MKTLKLKFPRKPQYTPGTLSGSELTRIERLVKVSFRGHRNSVSRDGWSEYERGEEYDRLNFRINNTGGTRGRMNVILSRTDAQDYFLNCYRYLLAVGRNKGELGEYRQSAKKWAMAAGYYE